MIKVFTTNCSAQTAGSTLTFQFEEWKKKGNYKVISFHTNSNGYGWSLTILYEIIEEK